MNISRGIYCSHLDCPYLRRTYKYTSDDRQNVINVTFFVFHQRDFNLLRFLASPHINSLEPRTYCSDKIFTNVKWLFDYIRLVGRLFVSLVLIGTIFFKINILPTVHRRMISNFRDDAQALTSRSMMLKSYALPKRNLTKVVFLTSLRISSFVSVKLQEYDSQK